MIVWRYPVYCQASVIGLTCVMLIVPAWAGRDSLPPGYPASLEGELALVQSQIATRGATVDQLIAAAELYLDMADDLFEEEGQKRVAYESAAEMAKRALQLDDRHAHAHFLYAAALGSAERIKGLANAGLVLGDIKAHVRRAIELDPAHAQALQMMGGLYAELPWLLGGSEKEAETYLRRAIAADGRYTNAHLLLARLLMKQGRSADARAHLDAVLRAEQPHYPYAWQRRFRPEAERLLKALAQ